MKGINLLLVVITLLHLVATGNAFAQKENEFSDYKPSQLKRFGRNAVLQGDHSTAAMYYDSYMVKRPSNYKIAYKLAECHRRAKEFRKAEAAYLKAYNLNPEKNALALFHYATMLKITGRYRQADDYYTKFKKEYKGKDKAAYIKMIKNNAKAAEYVERMINDPVKAGVTRLDSVINTGHVEAAPFFLNDSVIIYSSLRTDMVYYYFNPEDSSSNEPKRKFFVAKRNNDKWEFAGEFNGTVNDGDDHVSNGVFSADGTKFYFTKCRRNAKNKMICGIYVSTLTDNEWSEPVSLGNSVNDPKYTSTQPAIAKDLTKNVEIIYFVSDREDGKGGMDIWYTTYDNKRKSYKQPMNAGSKINTPGDEITPYFDFSSRTLYFSSDGWQGIGGLDVFKTFGEYKKWTAPENLGAPLNSSFDDLYYVLQPGSRENAMLVSNRESTGLPGVSAVSGEDDVANVKGCCDDIFSVKWLDAVELFVTGNLYEAPDSLIQTTEKIPIRGARVILEQKNAGDTAFVAVNGNFTDEKGKYAISLMPDREYRLVTKKSGYLNSIAEFNTFGRHKSENIDIDMSARPAPFDDIPLQNIYYEYGKATLTHAAMEAIDTTLFLLLTNNPDMAIELSSHTDNIGSDEANRKLSQRRAESVVNYLIAKGINSNSLIARGYGESQPIAPNQHTDGTDNPEGRQLNRRTQFKIIGKLTEDGKIRERSNF